MNEENKKEEIKLPEDLLLEIQSLKDSLTENVVKVGRLNVQKSFYERDFKMLNEELDELYAQSAIISKKEEEMEIRITTQYGAGRLDLASGVFIKQ